jgi:hypothetical protein
MCLKVITGKYRFFVVAFIEDEDQNHRYHRWASIILLVRNHIMGKKKDYYIY